MLIYVDFAGINVDRDLLRPNTSQSSGKSHMEPSPSLLPTADDGKIQISLQATKKGLKMLYFVNDWTHLIDTFSQVSALQLCYSVDLPAVAQ